MLEKQERIGQFSFFDIRLEQLINLEYLLGVMVREVDSDFIEVKSTPFFSHTGRPYDDQTKEAMDEVFDISIPPMKVSKS